MVCRVWLAIVVCFLVASRSFVSTAPSHGALNDGNIDEDVRELEKLKPHQGSSMKLVKSHAIVYSNINGHNEHHEDRKEEVEKNGELVARVEQELDKTAQNGEPHVKTSLDIPSKNLHKVIEHGPKPITEQRRSQNRLYNEPPSQYKQNSGLQYTPLDMAEYVFWTGDERGATTAIEEFLENGLMTRDEAIAFLEEIKQNLELLKNHYQNEAERPRLQYSQRERYYGTSPGMSDMRRMTRGNSGKTPEFLDSLGNLYNDNSVMADEDYEELVERLKMVDLMYNEYSLEEVIYQLAKIMFRSNEAQEALQKFTDFLDNEAQQGKISRDLEKKVLDVVIASLSDTLTQYPELVSVARQTLLTPEPQRFIQPKQGIAEGQSSIPLFGEPHRFQSPKDDRDVNHRSKKSN